ncbi:MAG: DUF2207 domain-containing protein [Bacteroidales bacterium]|nr:DUF2207 domain-containing protein [Bacteroidales bacterium]
MKKLFLLALAASLSLLSSAQEIRDIETTVRLFKTGNALVVQTWDITVTEGTEWYIPVCNPGKSRITRFRVFEHDQEFDCDEEWNSKRSMEAKARRCGIARKKGQDIELCWGLGSHGDHVFTLVYVIENLVQAYEDCDGFHWHFLNDEWSVCPRHASITFLNETDGDAWYRTDPEHGNVRFWGFGMEGSSGIADGIIRFESSKPFRYASFFSALICFDKGLFDPQVSGDGTFEALKKTAFEGSDYGKREDGFDSEKAGRILAYVLLLIPILFVGVILSYIFFHLYWKITGRRYKKSIFGKNKIAGWSRDIPLDGNPTALFSLLCDGDNLVSNVQKRLPNLVSAYFLKWIQSGLLEVEKDAQKEGRVNLRFVEKDDISFGDAMEKRIYRAALEAAGQNRLLEADEFKAWSYRHDEVVLEWPKDAVSEGAEIWRPLSPEERCHAVEFRNFLNDFTLIDQRQAPEVGLWQQYMVLAAAMGIADKVARNFEKLFPKVMEEYSRTSHMRDMTTTYTVLQDLRLSSAAMVASAAKRDAERKAAEARERRDSGGGGSISFGGGGGGFGGGHGGGAR